MIILIHPPVAKPCEPPAGVARLSGMLGRLGVDHRLFDANIEGLLDFLEGPFPAGGVGDTWSKRAFRDLGRNLSLMRSPLLYRQRDRYGRTVRDISRVLHKMSPPGAQVGLVNYENKELSPLRSRDLLFAAERPEIDPFHHFFVRRLNELFDEKEPVAVGISLNYLSQALSAFSMIGVIKKALPSVKIILGGGLVTSWLRSPHWHDPFTGLVDHFVSGPGEDTLPSLLGLAAKKERMPKPDYLSLPLSQYLSPGVILPYSGSAGCYWNRCDFCPEKAEENPYIPLPPQEVLSDLTDLAAEVSPALIHLLDNALSPALLHALTSSGPGVDWYGFARVGPYLTDLDFCLALKRSGCVMLKLGIESGDQGVLDAMQKGISLEDASIALRNLKKAGIATYVYLIFGTPAENEDSAMKTLDFTVKRSDCIDFLNLAIFNMPVGKAAAAGIETKNFYEGDLSLYTDFVHPAAWGRRNVRLFLENRFRRHPAISSILRKDPPFFTSNHAPFFVRRNGRESHK